MAFVQSPTIPAFTSATSFARAFGTNNTAGNMLIAAIDFVGITAVPSISDTRGNTWVAVTPIRYSPNTLAYFYCLNCAAGANTVTVLLNAVAAVGAITIAEYSGVNAVDKNVGTNGTGTAMSSGATATTVATETLIGFYASNAGGIASTAVGTGGSGTIIRSQQPNAGAYAFGQADNFVTATGSYAATGTDITGAWAAAILTLFLDKWSITGSAGTASATVAWTGTSSGSVSADGSGNYTIPNLASGSYTITPSKTGFSFSPTNSPQTVNKANITGVNFTATQIVVATPTFSPVAGAYGPTQNVTVSDTDSGLAGFAMYYTTDGSTPTTGSTLYSGPVAVSSSLTLKVLATATGYANSIVGSAAYTINGAVATPTFNPVAGSYGPTQNVTISSVTAGASFFYTTDGSTPTTGSTPYTVPVVVASSLTLKALATKTGFSDSTVGSAAYTINGAVATPTFSPVAGTYTSTQNVTISSVTAGASFFYTTDGSTPTTGSTPYTVPVVVASSLTLKALGTKTGFSDSSVGSAGYIISSASAHSVQDCRNYGQFPNNSVDVQGTLTYTVPAHPSHPAPTDSRTAGAPVDSRVTPNIPLNSRT